MVPHGGQPGPMQMGMPRGQMRNPTTELILTIVTCFLYGAIASFNMVNELKALTKDESLTPWHQLVPILNMIAGTKIGAVVARAKQMAGSRNPQPQGTAVYVFVPAFGLAKDLNEIYNPGSMS